MTETQKRSTTTRPTKRQTVRAPYNHNITKRQKGNVIAVVILLVAGTLSLSTIWYLKAENTQLRGELRMAEAMANKKTEQVIVYRDVPAPVAVASDDTSTANPASKAKAKTKTKAAKPKTKRVKKSTGATKRIYFYCACSKCCGKSTGITSSGRHVKEGRTCATSDYKPGTVLDIDGVGRRVVEDRGCPAGSIDVYVDSHARANKLGTFNSRVRVVGHVDL